MKQRIKVPRPDAVYQRVYGQHHRRIYVVGDVHGEYDALMAKLSAIKFDRDRDLLISAGDMIDRGPKSMDCLALLDEPWFTAVRGNHEDLAMASMPPHFDEHACRVWLSNGGGWHWMAMREHGEAAVREAILSCVSLPYVLEVRTKKKQTVVVVHGCYPYDTYAYNQPIDVFASVWDQRRLFNRKRGFNLHTQGADLFVHGHNGVETLTEYGNHRYIDTFYRGGELTVLRIQ